MQPAKRIFLMTSLSFSKNVLTKIVEFTRCYAEGISIFEIILYNTNFIPMFIYKIYILFKSYNNNKLNKVENCAPCTLTERYMLFTVRITYTLFRCKDLLIIIKLNETTSRQFYCHCSLTIICLVGYCLIFTFPVPLVNN